MEPRSSEQSWDGSYKFKFNWLGECYKKHNSAGRIKAFVCTNGVVVRTSPTGIKASCRVSKVRVNKKGKITQLVKENYIAWHAGKSKWRKFTNLNKNSVGIELVNKGHSHGYENFPKLQN